MKTPTACESTTSGLLPERNCPRTLSTCDYWRTAVTPGVASLNRGLISDQPSGLEIPKRTLKALLNFFNFAASVVESKSPLLCQGGDCASSKHLQRNRFRACYFTKCESIKPRS